MDSSQIEIEIGFVFWRISRKHLRAYLFWKNKPYPENYIGCGIGSVSKSLNISCEEASQLLVKKLNELLSQTNDSVLRQYILKKIMYFQNLAISNYKSNERKKHALQR